MRYILSACLILCGLSGIERVIERGISPQSILDALRSPLKVGPILTKAGRSEQKMVGKSAVIVINPETGKIITT